VYGSISRASELARSDGTADPGMARMSFAISDRFGKALELNFHHSKGLIFSETGPNEQYFPTWQPTASKTGDTEYTKRFNYIFRNL
jgi:hypothetical protein